MSLYTTEYYKQINAEEGEQARRLADILIWKYRPKSVLDIGCATGLYLKPYFDSDIKCFGIDYSESVISDEVLQVPRDIIKIMDITKDPIDISTDLTICLEVLEHIDPEYAANAIKNICQNSKIILFSAAQPGQGGIGHINCQPKEYWSNLFAAQQMTRKFKDEEYVKILLSSGYHLGWLYNNLMIFEKA